MISWKKILKEEVMFSSDFELQDNNDKFVIDSVIESYKEKIAAHPIQVKEILDGAHLAGFKLGKRRFSSKTVFVLYKSYKNAHLVFQFSIKQNTFLACEIAYGKSSDEGLQPIAKKSKYFPTVWNTFDKSLPLDFMNPNEVKEKLQDDVFISIKDEYENWSEFFNYVYYFMVCMLDKLNDDEIEYLSENIVKSNEEINKNKLFTDGLRLLYPEMRIEINDKMFKNELMIFLDLLLSDIENSLEIVNDLNTHIEEFKNYTEKDGAKVSIDRGRSKTHFIRSIFIKY